MDQPSKDGSLIAVPSAIVLSICNNVHTVTRLPRGGKLSYLMNGMQKFIVLRPGKV